MVCLQPWRLALGRVPLWGPAPLLAIYSAPVVNSTSSLAKSPSITTVSLISSLTLLPFGQRRLTKHTSVQNPESKSITMFLAALQPKLSIWEYRLP